MGYLSCKAESSISISDSQSTPSSSKKSQQYPPPQSNNNSKKPIKIQHFHYSDLEAATNGFSDQKLLGRGSHGLVYKAVLGNGRLVAVKKPSYRGPIVPSPHRLADNPNEVENEIDILSKLNSPRLVNLVGFTNDPPRDRLLVVEFMSNGTLYDTLHLNPRPPNWGRRIRLALQTAGAIDTLHSSTPPVIHRDIKSANILIDRNFNARLGDFGLALSCPHVNDFRFMSTPPAGTMGYLDPAYVTPDNLSTKTDVFSFGILLLEIISGRKAIDVGHSPPSIVDWAIPLIRRGKHLGIYDPRIPPPRDPSARKQLAVIAAKCVRTCRERRPTMKEIFDSLTGLTKLVPLHSWNGLTNPCLMVETMGRTVELASSRTKNVEENADNRPLKNSRRVYSDLGFRSNLLDLLAGPDGESEFLEAKSKSKNGGSSFRSENGINVGIKKNEKGSAFNLRRNQSVGEESNIYSRPLSRMARSNSTAQVERIS